MNCPRCNAGDTVEMTISHGLRCYACGLHGAELERAAEARRLSAERLTCTGCGTTFAGTVEQFASGAVRCPRCG